MAASIEHYQLPLPAFKEAVRLLIVVSPYYRQIADGMIEGAQAVAKAAGATVDLVEVPGALEVPTAIALAAARGLYDGYVALGCVIRGETRHYEHVADGCANALMQVALDHGLPVLNGVLAVERHEDALARAGGSHGNKGEEAALAAIEMADLLERLT